MPLPRLLSAAHLTMARMRMAALGLGTVGMASAGLATVGLATGTALLLPGRGSGLATDAKPPLAATRLPSGVALELPTQAGLPRSQDGRHYPLVPASPTAIASLLGQVEAALRDPATPEALLPRLGHQHQVIVRRLSRQVGLAQQVRALLPKRWQPVLDRHLRARRAFLAMHRGDPISRVPSWRIVAPEPAAELLRYYRKAAVATGIDWEVLAAVNLVETGMGRIDGLSVANAQGPMQFLPSTWAERGIGEGDIRDPHDAIQAAARYLVRRGGLKDIRRGLWGYNNSRHYGEAVLQYAQLLKEDPQAFRGLYHWEILIATSAGDLWLPVGYQQARPLAVETYLQQVPVSRPAQP